MRRGDARAWLAWTAAGGWLAASTRSPVTLILLVLVVAVTAVRCVPPQRLALGWRPAATALLWLVAATVLFNVLLVRSGDVVLGRLPPVGPLGAATVTLNAVIYGLTNALSLIALVGVWLVFNGAVSHSHLLRLVPPGLRSVGLVGSIALTYLPGLVRTADQIREAQAVRGHQARGPRDLPPLVVPLLSTGLERGFALAEAMEARGFAATAGAPVWPPITGAALAGAGLLLVQYGQAGPGLLLLAGGGGLCAGLLIASRRGATRYARQRWDRTDTAISAASLTSVALILAAVATGDPGLAYNVYPTLEPPALSPLAIAAVLTLLMPAIVSELRQP